MTTISSVDEFFEETRRLLDTKENPEEWYFLSGQQVGEYSIKDSELPEEVPDDPDDHPPEAEMASQNVDGAYQIGSTGWSEDAFDDDVEFVADAGFSQSYGKIDRRVNGLLLVHESVLSEEALALAQDDDGEEVPADA